MEIIFHKCEFVGEMAVVQQAQRNLCLESYDRIEQTLKHCIEAKMLPADLMTRRAAIIMRGYISGLMENWLFAPQSFDLKKKPAITSPSYWRCISCAPRFVTLPLTNNPESDSRNFPDIFVVAILVHCVVIFLRFDFFRSFFRFRNLHSSWLCSSITNDHGILFFQHLLLLFLSCYARTRRLRGRHRMVICRQKRTCRHNLTHWINKRSFCSGQTGAAGSDRYISHPR